jgi:hypothetical protein
MGGKLIRLHFWSLEYENGTKRTWHCAGCETRIILDETDREEIVKAGSRPTMLELTRHKIDRSCPRTAKPQRPRVMRETTHLVVIARGATADVTGFSDYEDAAMFFRIAASNWPEAYLSVVVSGPGRPLPTVENPHCSTLAVSLRQALGATLCKDEKCTLSGGYAHAGPCIPCKCPLKHAISECPETKT